MRYAYTNYTSQEALDKAGIKGTYLGEVVVVFDGSNDEAIGSRHIDGRHFSSLQIPAAGLPKCRFSDANAPKKSEKRAVKALLRFLFRNRLFIRCLQIGC